MSFFCLLWMPLFYLFRRTLTPDDSGAGGVWALLLGSIAAIIQFFLGDLIKPGGFGLSRWVSACIDIVTFPAILPLLVCFLFLALKVVSGPIDFANFALLWLIPGAAVRAVSWSAGNGPAFLVLVPLLWTAVAVGVSFFINLFLEHFRWYVIIPSGLCILVLPFAAATSWWAFYSQQFLRGSLFLAAAALPLLISMILSWVKLRR
ncbi:MAG: hypothetical protein LBC62_04555 [Treponema sp.]|jgi:hypothetical protein|nr:hypothetical protein [Treponema sp.]